MALLEKNCEVLAGNVRTIGGYCLYHVNTIAISARYSVDNPSTLDQQSVESSSSYESIKNQDSQQIVDRDVEGVLSECRVSIGSRDRHSTSDSFSPHDPISLAYPRLLNSYLPRVFSCPEDFTIKLSRQ